MFPNSSRFPKEKTTRSCPEALPTSVHDLQEIPNEIKRALRRSYSNGPIECLNNHIKVLKRIAYGYRNFQNYRERIFYIEENILRNRRILPKRLKARTTNLWPEQLAV